MSKRMVVLLVMMMVVMTIVPQVSAINGQKEIVVYFPNWGTYNDAQQHIQVGDMPWGKMTVVNHGFFEITSDYKIQTTDKFADYSKTFPHSDGWGEADRLAGHFGEYRYYKSKYPNVKLLISVGGWTRSEMFHEMAATAANRATFAQSLISFMEKYPFVDGFDLDWEYPGVERPATGQYNRGNPAGPEDKQNFTLLLKDVREAFDNAGMQEKMLTVAVSAGSKKIAKTEPDKYHQYLDYIGVMTYDFHGAWNSVTNHHSPIYPNPNDPSPAPKNTQWNTKAALEIFAEEYNVPKEKLLGGTPLYSRGWGGVDPNTGENGMFAETDGTDYKGVLGVGGQEPWWNLKQLENTAGWEKYRDPYTKTPWLYNRDKQVVLTYEDEESLKARCDLINNNDYGGLIVWDASGDNAKSTMLNIMNNKLLDGSTPDPVEPAPELSVDNATNTGDFTLTISVPENSSATSVKLYEGSNVVLEKNVTASDAITELITGKAVGTYDYKAELITPNANVSSKMITVTVEEGSSDPYPAWEETKVYTGGEKVTYNGSVWEAKWWTKGSEPGASNWGPWKLVE